MLQLCRVTGSLSISDARSACSAALLRQEGVTLCVNVSRRQPFPADAAVARLQVPVYDDPGEDLYSHFDGCADAIHQEAQRGGRALVYCKNGRSRSAAVCIAYLMKHQRLSLAEAAQVGHLSWGRGGGPGVSLKDLALPDGAGGSPRRPAQPGFPEPAEELRGGAELQVPGGGLRNRPDARFAHQPKH